GGMCTSWQRKDYAFDYCIHNLGGTSPKSGLRRVWDELGALDGTAIIDHDEFVCVEGPSGEQFHWYTDLDRLESHLKEIAPADAGVIRELVGGARRFAAADLFSVPLGGIRAMLKALRYLPTVKRWSEITMGRFAERFTHPFLRRAWVHAQYDIPGTGLPMTAPLMFMGELSNGDLGWPAGGSLAFSRRIEQRFLDLGGAVHYRSPVEEILVENGRAVGVRLVDGTEHRAASVVSAADGYSTIYRMLRGRYLTESIEKYYAVLGDEGPFGLTIFLGLQGELEEQPHALTLLLDEGIDLGEISQDSLHVVTFGPESGLVPEGKSIVKVEAQARYPYWKDLRDDDLHAYRRQKEAVAQAVIDRISPRFPGLKERIEVVDVSTFATAERFTGNRFGAQAMPPKENAAAIQRHGLSKTLPGLDGFHHVGQWSSATLGVSSAALSGRDLVRGLCKEDGRRFKTA
ncbi:MAG: NAD(P)/FAD-dependent oxidoreductase, partial [Coriobacteriia bacterium]|nr:NAD(P)/FAD-dependent oxidoreductase [Coriobacteriia bacterium]